MFFIVISDQILRDDSVAEVKHKPLVSDFQEIRTGAVIAGLFINIVVEKCTHKLPVEKIVVFALEEVALPETVTRHRIGSVSRFEDIVYAVFLPNA